MPSRLTELRRAFRALRRTPGATALMLATIAVGVGGLSAVFSAVNALMLRPLPFPRAGEIITIDVTSAKGYHISASIPCYRDWGAGTHSFSAWAGMAGQSFTLEGKDGAELLSGQLVIGDLFKVFGVAPAVGRVFTDAETQPGAPPLAVLGHALWERRFGGDAAVVGSAISLGGRPYTVVGVLPADFAYPAAESDLYVNMGSVPGLPFDDRGSGFGTRIYGRMKPGVTLAAATADVARIGALIKEREGPRTELPAVRAFRAYLLGDGDRQLWLLFAAVGALLIVALSNVGGLVMARATDRRRDVALRLTLGGRWRHVVRQFVIENLILMVAGGALGLTVAAALVRALVPMLPADLPATLTSRIGLDGWTVLAVLVVCLTAGATLGIVAAATAASPDLAAALKSGGHGMVRARRGARGVLIVVETALSLVLAVEASLLLTSFVHLRHADKGFDDAGVLTARVAATSRLLPTDGQWTSFYETLIERSRALPGVRAAAVSLLVPLTPRSWELSVEPAGMNVPIEDAPSVLYNIVSEDWFATMGVALIRGRAFTAADDDRGAPVAIIDETMARQFWPNDDPIGKRVTVGDRAADSTLIYRTVVGVAKNVRHYALRSPSRIQVYVPLRQSLRRFGPSMVVSLKTSVPPMSLVAPLRRTVTALDARVPIWDAATASNLVDGSIAGERAVGVVTSWLALVAAIVTAVGLFGIVSYSVVQRRREIALRMALGAETGSVVALMTWSGLSLTLVGVAIGLAASAAVSRLVSAFLYGVQPLDPATWLAATGGLLAVAALATIVPALRARRFSPALVLREE